MVHIVAHFRCNKRRFDGDLSAYPNSLFLHISPLFSHFSSEANLSGRNQDESRQPLLFAFAGALFTLCSSLFMALRRGVATNAGAVILSGSAQSAHSI